MLKSVTNHQLSKLVKFLPNMLIMLANINIWDTFNNINNPFMFPVMRNHINSTA